MMSDGLLMTRRRLRVLRRILRAADRSECGRGTAEEVLSSSVNGPSTSWVVLVGLQMLLGHIMGQVYSNPNLKLLERTVVV